MSLVEREMTPAQIAASQANGKKSQGPKTPEGKARVSLNALKTGAYAKTEKARREIMLRRGENPDDFEQLHQEFTEEWQPGYVTEAMLVKTIAEKSFDKAQLRAAWTESGTSPSEPPETTSGVASPGQSAVATEQRPADVEPAPHAGPTSSSQSAVATEPRAADEPTGRSEGASFAANAENPSENPPTERKPVVGGQGGSKNEKTGQSNLVSAA